MKKIKIIIDSASKIKVFEKMIDSNITYEEIATEYEDEFVGQVVLAESRNHLHELSEDVDEDDSEIILHDTTSPDGYRVYLRSLSFIFIKAVKTLFPEKRVLVEHSISSGLYFTIRNGEKLVRLDSRMRDALKEEMRRIVYEDKKIHREEMPVHKAYELFSNLGRKDKANLLKYREKGTIAVYHLGGDVDSFFGFMVPSTRYVNTFDLELFDHGIVVMGPEEDKKGIVHNFIPQYKLSQTYNEAEDWSELQNITSVPKLNELIENGEIGDVCRVMEAFQQNKIMKIAEEINKRGKKIILIAAPSSSGKTSFAYKLTTSLRVLGHRPIAISTDDYYVDREDTPLDENGEYDFESLYSIDLEYFNRDLNKLMRGEEIERIRFDFVTGKRVHTGEMLKLSANDSVIIEGIHGLNPILTENIAEEYKYRIYLSVITQINLDDHNRISTTDLRLMRRIARDMQFRGRTPKQTISEWQSVRKGEIRNIFPFSEEADVMFNSSFIFEFAAIKPIIFGELEKITEEEPEYIEAVRLKSFLQYFTSLEDSSDIINTSILREFIGGSKIV